MRRVFRPFVARYYKTECIKNQNLINDEDSELAVMSWLHSMCDPKREFCNNDVEFELKEYGHFAIPEDYDAEMAWRHVMYDPPKLTEKKI
ncbi:hypothetical protein Indivirus_1_145 [Indivirus ILV1]|uniref:Uncharacterized protein n=1 Tax=Indivirus ILV1 TaxID=1977633 RepID=A0A1V0SCT4_9VIRU|nr:hypothetical protein Indivirus_1_145 [Indivirus ILV1]